MKKCILGLELQDGKEKRKALKTVSALSGIDEISIDTKGKKLIVIGTVDPVSVASKLRKFWPTHILFVGPAKEPEPEKKEEPKKEEAKKEEPKKEAVKEEEPKTEEEPKKDEEPKKEEPKKQEVDKEPPKKEEENKAEPEPEPVIGTVMPYRPYHPRMQQMPYRPYYPPPMQQAYYHMHHSIEENPNACVIS